MQTLRYLLLATLAFVLTAPLSAQNGELLLFFQAGDNVVTQDFKDVHAPKIREMAEAQGISVKEIALKDEVPELIHFTPAIVFQNHLGRSLYVGRYHYVDKIKTFIRTVKRMPQREAVNKKHDVVVWENGRTTIVTPVKVTDLTGELPKNFDQAEFHKKALAAIDKGMDKYNFQEHYDAVRTDRLMYTALYPYRSEDGKLFISTEVYSQFNCVDPVYKEFDEPVSGNWKDWEKVFAEAGKMLQGKIIEQLESVERGDGLVALEKGVKVKSFDKMGHPLPEKPEGLSQDFSAVDVTLANTWKMAGPISDEVPVVAFAFLPPLDYYAGEINKVNGTLKLGADRSVDGSIAAFTATLKDLTMGDESLDEHIGEMIDLIDYPEATFTFKSINVLDQPQINWGAVTQFMVEGSLDFKGIQAPLSVSAQLEPVLTEAGEQRLQVFASFRLPLRKNYDVEGPDGSKEASDNLDFQLNFLLMPQ